MAKSLVTKNDTLTATISKEADLIIGQSFLLTVTLKSKNIINIAHSTLTFTGVSKNISVPQGEFNLTLDPSDHTQATYTTILSVTDDYSIIKENDPIQFTIKIKDSDAEFPFNGKARTINPDSLSLIFDNKFLIIQNQKNAQKQDEVATVSTTLIGTDPEKPLSGVPIFITAEILDNFNSCTIKGDKGQELTLQTIGSFTGLFINSDNDGNIKFTISPNKATSMVLELKSWVLNVGQFVYADSPLFIINSDIPKFPFSLRAPNIQGGFPGPLISDTGASNFYISIPMYSGAARNDYILFLTKNLVEENAQRKYTGHYVMVGDTKTELGDAKYAYSLPYDIFDYGVPFDINYIVILGQGAGSLTSLPSPVTYMGGARYQPDSKIKREYGKCKVYTSYGVQGPKIHEGTTIGYDSIKKYYDNKPTDTSQPVTGLFIEIMGGYSKGQVPYGSKVTLNMYIQAKNCNTKKTVGTLIMPKVANKYTGHHSLVFHIGLKTLANILPYDNGGPGSIWFDYQVGARSYGEIWEGNIDTRQDAFSEPDTPPENDTLTATISKEADLIIGQSFLLTVTLKSKDIINIAHSTLTFTGAGKNISVPQGEINLTLDPSDHTQATYITILSVTDDSSIIKENDSIQFTIKIKDSDAEFSFNGKARTINPDSLSIMFDNIFLDIKNIENDHGNTDKKSMATTLLLDKQGEVLIHVPIFIKAKTPENLRSCKILYDDNQTSIPIIEVMNDIGLSINSDSQGNIKFYIYPQKSDSMVLELESWVLGVENPVPATSPLFLVNTEIPDFLHTIPEPNILGGFPGPLISNAGEPNFYVGIYNYPNSTPGDYILFFTKEKNDPNSERQYSGHYVNVDNPNTELGLDKYSYSLPYDIFKVGVPYDFNYVVILGKNASSITSIATTVTYMGGAKYHPLEKVKRDYDPCKVYTSLGVDKVEIPAGTTIGYDSIKKYLDNPVGSTGLFIEIVGDKDSKTNVPLGTKVTLNMYIEASNRNTKIPFGPQTMPIKIDSQTNRYSLVFHIEKKCLVNIFPYDNGGAGSIWFEYEFGTENNKRYSKIWEGSIDTRSEILTGDDD